MKQPAAKKTKNAQKRITTAKSISALRKWLIGVIGLLIVIAGGVGIFYGWRAYRMHQERPRFAQVEQDIRATYGTLTRATGRPADAAYVHFCARPSSEAFEGLKPLSCFMDEYFVYNTDNARAAGALANKIKDTMRASTLFTVTKPLKEKEVVFTDDTEIRLLNTREEAIESYTDNGAGSRYDCTISYDYHATEDLQSQMPKIYPSLGNLKTSRVLFIDLGCEAYASHEYYPPRN